VVKVNIEHISNIFWEALMQRIEGPLGHCRCETYHHDEAMFLIQIKRALAERKKRIIINVKYPK
jgi:hypothetical protein